MPLDLTTFREQHRRFEQHLQGGTVADRDTRRRNGGAPPAPPLRLNGMANRFVAGLALLAALRPGSATSGERRDGRPGASWPPGAQATETIAMTTQAPQDVEAGMPMLAANAPVHIVNSALLHCVQRPADCRGTVATAALVTGATVLGGTLVGLGDWLTRPLPATSPTTPPPLPAVRDAPRFSYDPDLLPPGLTAAQLPHDLAFNASQLDPGVSPCTSLYDWVNRPWQDAVQLEDSRSERGAFTDLRDRALHMTWQLAMQMAALEHPEPNERVIANLLQSGMDSASRAQQDVAPLQPELDAIDQLQGSEDVVAHMHRLAAESRNPLFEFAALPDMEDSSRHMLYIAQAGLGLPDSAWYQDPAKAETRALYLQHIERMLALSGLTQAQASAAAAEVMTVEQALAEASVPFAVLTNDISQYYNPTDLASCGQHTPGLDWQSLFGAHGMAPPARFSLGMPAYFARLDALMHILPLSTWQAYFRFHAVDNAAPQLSERFVLAHEDFHGRVLKGRARPVPTWAAVMGTVERIAGEALAPAYASIAYTQPVRLQVEQLSTVLREQLQRRLAVCDWMDAPTRQRALDKAAKIRLDIGIPPEWRNWDGVDTQPAGYLENVNAVKAFNHRFNVARYDQPVSGTEWRMTPQTADAYHDVLENRIVVPAALLQPPFFSADADMATNFGGIGVVLAHEFAHAFDLGGSQFGANGTRDDWWSEQSRAQMTVRAQQLSEQLAHYQVAGEPVDGGLTVDESLADVAGLQIALDALLASTVDAPDPLLDGLSRPQRFFANYARCWRRHATPERTKLDMATDDHAPPRVRTDVGASNVPAFSTTFNCSADSPMHRTPSQQVRFL